MHEHEHEPPDTGAKRTGQIREMEMASFSTGLTIMCLRAPISRQAQTFIAEAWKELAA